MTTNTIEAEQCKDFHTGKMGLRFRYQVPSHPCANCGTHTVNYDGRYGWHVCQDCDSDETASELARDIMTGGGLF